MEVKQIGNMDTDRENFENPQCGRVYDSSGLSPTINTCQGGQREPKIIVENIPCKLDKMKDGHLVGAEDFGICNVGTETASTVTARYYKGLSAHKDNMCIVAMRGRNPSNPSDRTAGSPTEQRLEPNSQGICNTLTSVQKDNMVLENVYDFYNSNMKSDGLCGTITGGCAKGGSGTFGVIESQYRIRKLTPLECWRLMGFSDEDFLAAKLGSREKAKEVLEKYPHLGKRAFTEAQRIEKMSNSQLYKQAGNSIVKNILMAIFGQMIPGKENIYKEL